MPTPRFYILAALQAILLSAFIYRPFTNMTTQLSSTPWADHPCALITTPQFATKKNDTFTTAATHMAHVHNAILRGYNSIFLQATHVKDADKPDLIGYALTWYRFVKSHHDDEENELFPKVAALLGKEDIWAETHAEHESFLQGLAENEKYLTSLPTPSSFDGNKLLGIMSTFQTSFVTHFHNEITTIASLAGLPEATSLTAQQSSDLAMVFKVWGKKTVTKAGILDVTPFFLYNLDGGFEEGMWKDWPPMPRVVRWGLVNGVGWVYGGWWRFASCDGVGGSRVLVALEGDRDGDERR